MLSLKVLDSLDNEVVMKARCRGELATKLAHAWKTDRIDDHAYVTYVRYLVHPGCQNVVVNGVEIFSITEV